MAKTRFALITAIGAIAAFSGGASVLAQPAAAPPLSTDVPVYQGGAFVTIANTSCTNNDIATGDYYTMIYRQDVRPGNTEYGGGIQFVNESSGVSYVMPARTPLNGGHQVQTSVTAYGLSSEAGPFNYRGGFDLTISPTTLTATTPGVSITGSVTNFFDYPGCTISIRAFLALHP